MEWTLTGYVHAPPALNQKDNVSSNNLSADGGEGADTALLLIGLLRSRQLSTAWRFDLGRSLDFPEGLSLIL